MTTVDIHTHMLSEAWMSLVQEHAGPEIFFKPAPDGGDVLVEEGAVSFTTCPEMFDCALRIKDMDEAGIDVSIVSLTAPSVYWGSSEVSAQAARQINDDVQQAQTTYPDRLRYFATLPWQFPELAVAELARACQNGAVGVMVLATIRGIPLIDPSLEPIWQEIDRRGLPVLVHPAPPPGTPDMDLGRLLPSVGFTFDTSLAISRMILDGFLDRYPNLSIIAAHGGGTLPYLAGRLDLFFEKRFRPEDKKIAEPPSQHLSRIYYDSIVYQPTCLKLCIEMGGPERVLFGTDYPHPAEIPFLMAMVDDLPADQTAAVRGGNALRLIKL